MNVLDLFSGIGGFSLGLERAGMRTVAFCEIEPYCRAVLRKHWPDVPIWKDVRRLTATELGRAGVGPVDVICGGFPCQDISNAGKRAGIDGERSGLWREYARLVSELRPRFVIVENVAALLGRGIGRVLGDLAEIGYDAEWHCIPASAVGAPHERDRLWIIAHPDQTRCAHPQGRSRQTKQGRWQIITPMVLRSAIQQWETEPEVLRVVHGDAANVDAVAALGNAVVPQIPEIIGRAIMSLEQ